MALGSRLKRVDSLIQVLYGSQVCLHQCFYGPGTGPSPPSYLVLLEFAGLGTRVQKEDASLQLSLSKPSHGPIPVSPGAPCTGLSHLLRPRISHTGSKIHRPDPRKGPVQTLEAGLRLRGYGIPTSQVLGRWSRGKLRLQVSTPVWAHRVLVRAGPSKIQGLWIVLWERVPSNYQSAGNSERQKIQVWTSQTGVSEIYS